MPIVRDILRLIFPDLCYHCGEPLVGDEHNLCTLCLSKIAWTHNALHPDNDTEIRLTGRIPVVAAASLLQFNKGNVTQSIVHQIKYHGNTQLAHHFGLLLGEELKASGRFGSIDIVAPVPLHWWRRMRRGYNQSQLIASEVAKVLQCPLSTHNLYRRRHTPSQTHKNRQQRIDNMASAFAVRHPEQFEGKHLLLIDDVLTTGATTEACYHALQSIPDLRVSVATLAIAST